MSVFILIGDKDVAKSLENHKPLHHHLCKGYCVWSIQDGQPRHYLGPLTAHLAFLGE